MLLRLIFFGSVVLGCTSGCNQGRPARVAAPDWDPDRFADAVLEKLDASGDGSLDKAELAGAPGLAWGAKYIDTDKNELLSRDELEARFQWYRERRVGLTSKPIQLLYKKRPLVGAKVRLAPEFFLDQVIEPAVGETDMEGAVDPSAEGLDQPSLQPGYYRVVIDSPRVKIPAQYASAESTPLGVEIAPYSNDPAAYGAIQLQLLDK